MIKLGVNIDHIATVRNARGGVEPEVVVAAGIVERAGADSVVMHLREDRRHIKDNDILLVKNAINIKLNMEMSIAEDIVKKALEVVPNQATLVPERRRELTTEGGLDVIKYFSEIKDVVKELQKKNIIVSLFVDPDFKQIEKAKETGAEMIEIHTGHYANSFFYKKYLEEAEKIKKASKLGKELGFEVACGHGLTYQNVKLIAKIKEIEEFNIGHSIVSSAIFVGLYNAVINMKNIIIENRLIK